MLNCKNIFIVLAYIYLMMYVVKKTSNKYLLTILAVVLLFFRVEGFMSGFDGLVLTEPVKKVDLLNTSRKLSPLFAGYVPLNDHLANDSKDDMFLFKDNKCSPACCPSTYSCNGGCVCTTQQQKTLGQGRAGNNTVSDGPKPAEDITN